MHFIQMAYFLVFVMQIKENEHIAHKPHDRHSSLPIANT